MIASDIATFYQGHLGLVVQEILQAKISAFLSSTGDQRVLGLGFTSPYLKPEHSGFSFMLARSGVMVWPRGQMVRSALVDELNLPLADHTLDAVLVVHGLEFSENAEDMTHEVWRVLAPQGKVMFIVPNRRGLWARSEASPFGRGLPFSKTQLAALLSSVGFEVTGLSSCLVAPPMLPPSVLTKFEGLARFGLGGGVLVIEGVKRVHGFAPQAVHRRALPRLSPVLAGLRPANKV